MAGLDEAERGASKSFRETMEKLDAEAAEVRKNIDNLSDKEIRDKLNTIEQSRSQAKAKFADDTNALHKSDRARLSAGDPDVMNAQKKIDEIGARKYAKQQAKRAAAAKRWSRIKGGGLVGLGLAGLSFGAYQYHRRKVEEAVTGQGDGVSKLLGKAMSGQDMTEAEMQQLAAVYADDPAALGPIMAMREAALAGDTTFQDAVDAGEIGDPEDVRQDAEDDQALLDIGVDPDRFDQEIVMSAPAVDETADAWNVPSSWLFGDDGKQDNRQPGSLPMNTGGSLSGLSGEDLLPSASELDTRVPDVFAPRYETLDGVGVPEDQTGSGLFSMAANAAPGPDGVIPSGGSSRMSFPEATSIAAEILGPNATPQDTEAMAYDIMAQDDISGRGDAAIDLFGETLRDLSGVDLTEAIDRVQDPEPIMEGNWFDRNVLGPLNAIETPEAVKDWKRQNLPEWLDKASGGFAEFMRDMTVPSSVDEFVRNKYGMVQGLAGQADAVAEDLFPDERDFSDLPSTGGFWGELASGVDPAGVPTNDELEAMGWQKPIELSAVENEFVQPSSEDEGPVRTGEIPVEETIRNAVVADETIHARGESAPDMDAPAEPVTDSRPDTGKSGPVSAEIGFEPTLMQGDELAGTPLGNPGDFKTSTSGKSANLADDAEDAERQLNPINRMWRDRFGLDASERSKMARSLAAFGATMASTPGSFLSAFPQAVGAGFGEWDEQTQIALENLMAMEEASREGLLDDARLNELQTRSALNEVKKRVEEGSINPVTGRPYPKADYTSGQKDFIFDHANIVELLRQDYPDKSEEELDAMATRLLYAETLAGGSLP